MGCEAFLGLWYEFAWCCDHVQDVEKKRSHGAPPKFSWKIYAVAGPKSRAQDVASPLGTILFLSQCHLLDIWLVVFSHPNLKNDGVFQLGWLFPRCGNMPNMATSHHQPVWVHHPTSQLANSNAPQKMARALSVAPSLPPRRHDFENHRGRDQLTNVGQGVCPQRTTDFRLLLEVEVAFSKIMLYNWC